MIPLRDSAPARGWPLVTWALIGINVWVFFYELLLGPGLEEFARTWGFIPARYFALGEIDPTDWAGRYVPLFTSMFLHGGWMHLIGNMLFLWIFGDNVEDRMGRVRYLGFYLLTGLAAALTHAYLSPDSTVPTIGASGAISGVLGAYLMFFPHARVLTLVVFVFFIVDVIEVPAVLYLGLWFLMQLVSGTLTHAIAPDAGGVAWWAHVGGFVAGIVLARLLERREPRRAWQEEYAAW